MKRVFVLGCVLLATACGSKSFGSICDNQVPPPAACNTMCDPKPGAPDTCPMGYFCTPDGACDAQCTASGGECGEGYSCTTDGRCVGGENPCQGLQCQVPDCTGQGKPATTITGTVFAPNGVLPLFGVSVYVPNKPLPAFQDGVTCGSCSSGLPGDPIVATTTDDQGHFSLEGVPSGTDIPVVITIGKWRRQLKLSNVASCASQALEPTETRLPAARDDMTPNTTSVDLPQIAISTGSADSLECLVRRLGIADKEITTNAPAGTTSGRIHLYSDNGASNGKGASAFDTTFGGGQGAFADAADLWGGPGKAGNLNNYDIVILSCEGAQHAETKSQDAMDHLKAYADIGGRVFLSHWHNIWLEGSTQDTSKGTQKPKVWADTGAEIAKFINNVDTGNGTVDTIDEVNNPKGMSFANWMQRVQTKSPTRGQVTILDSTGKHTAISVDKTKAEQWVFWKNNGMDFPQNFQFTTPSEADQAARCGKVVFSDMHVSGGPLHVDGDNTKPVQPYPSSCGTATDLSDQEKALAFMFFDISSCVGVLF